MKNQERVQAILDGIKGDVDPQVRQRALLGARIDDESDRGALLVGVAYLDDALRRLLERAMHSSDENLFHGGESPLSSFSAKIKICRSLGLISQNVARNLEILRKIRNLAAHNWENIDLSSPQYFDRIFSLGYVKLTDDETPRSKEICRANGDAKQYLSSMMYELLTHIDHLAEETVPVDAFPRSWIDFSEDEGPHAREWMQSMVRIQRGEERLPRCWFNKGL